MLSPPPSARTLTLVLSLLLLLLRCLAGASEYPSEIRLNGAVLHSPPFAYIENVTGQPTYRGFTIDLLDRLKIFASMDNVDLKVGLSPAPDSYEEAFNWVANDCDNATDVYCDRFDLIVGDFYSNPERSMRADLSPHWLRSTTTTLKYIEKDEDILDLTTLREAEEARATVCVPQGTFMERFAWDKYPRGNYIGCEPNNGECVKLLKNGNCVLFVYDELILHHIASNDYTVEVTRESFNTQYMVWPFREDLPPMVSRLMKKWLYRAIQNNTVDDLYFQYFQDQLCPQGTAGKNCELPCDPDHGAANARGECVCISTKHTGDDCSVEVLEELNLLPTNLVVMCYTLAAVSFLVVASFAGWFIYNRKRAQVKITQPSFLLIILLGCVISTSTIIALAQEDAGDGPVHACMTIPWLYSVGFSLTFGAMFARIRRIYVALRYAAELTKVTVSAKETFLTVGLVLAIDVCILTIWTLVDPLEWERTTTSADVFGEPLESEGYCRSDNWAIFAGIIGAFHLLLMGTACAMTYIARNVPTRICNIKYVGIAMISNLQIFLMVVPVLLVVGSDPQTSFLVRSLAIWINDLAVVGLVCGNFIYRVYKFDQVNKEKSSRNLSIVASRVAVRDSIVNFARTTKSSSNLTDTSRNPSLNSQPSKRSVSVRFNDQVVHEHGLGESWTRLQNTFEEMEEVEREVEQSGAGELPEPQHPSESSRKRAAAYALDSEDILDKPIADNNNANDNPDCASSQPGAYAGSPGNVPERRENLNFSMVGPPPGLSQQHSNRNMPLASTSIHVEENYEPEIPVADANSLPDDWSPQLQKGKSDSYIIGSRSWEMVKGKSDSHITSRDYDDPDMSEHGNSSGAGASTNNEVLERPNLRRHRSHSEPSLSALKTKKPRGDLRLDPSLPQHRFMEILQVTYGQRAEATRADMPQEQFMELLEGTYGEGAGANQSGSCDEPTTQRTEKPAMSQQESAGAPCLNRVPRERRPSPLIVRNGSSSEVCGHEASCGGSEDKVPWFRR